MTPVVGDGFGGVAALSDVLSEVTLTDGPPTERRDIRVVGAHRARRPALASEVARVLAEVTRVKLFKRRWSILMPGEKIDEPAELPTCVLAVVPALTGLAFPLVRQEVLDNGFDPHHATRLRCTARRMDRRFQTE